MFLNLALSLRIQLHAKTDEDFLGVLRFKIIYISLRFNRNNCNQSRGCYKILKQFAVLWRLINEVRAETRMEQKAESPSLPSQISRVC